MKKIFLVILVCFLSSCFLLPSVKIKQAKQDIPMYRSVVMLTAFSRENKAPAMSATGFAIDKDYMLTAGHFCLDVVVGIAKDELVDRLMITYIDEKNTKKDIENLEIVKIGEKIDLCIIKSKNHTVPPVVFLPSISKLNYNDEIYSIGAPSGVFPTRVDGYTTQIAGDGLNPIQLDVGSLIVSLPVYGGFSGAPIFVKGTNAVAGVVQAVHRKYAHICIAVTVDEVLKFLNE